MAKQYTYHITGEGDKWLCSGYGIYPDGEKCKGCMDCQGRFLKKDATPAEVKKIFNKNHTTIRVGTKKGNRQLRALLGR